MSARASRALAAALAVLLLLPAASAAGRDEPWIEVRSPHFTVASNAGEKLARRAAREFEQIRAVFLEALPSWRTTAHQPVTILAVKNEKDLSALLPVFWEGRGPRPVGVFQRALGESFIVLRADAKGPHRYSTIYHEYFHLLVDLNLGRIPAWLNEGLAEFWDQTIIRKDTVEFGNPSQDHLEVLRSRPLLPLEQFLAIEDPHGKAPDQVFIFYAQAWALAHYIQLGDKTGATGRALVAYVKAVTGGADPLLAFVDAFGELEEMDKKLRRYIRRRSLSALRMETPDKVDEKSFALRTLSAAETATLRARFLVCGPRPQAALPLLEQALELEPESAGAHEVRGYFHHRQDQPGEAARWFRKAVDLGAAGFLAYYFDARFAMDSDWAEERERIEKGLERAIELNPGFAHAYGSLASVLASTTEGLERALPLARKARALAPKNAWFSVNLGTILLRLEQVGEARRAAEIGLALAESPADRDAAQSLLAEIETWESPARQTEARPESPAAGPAPDAGEVLPPVVRTVLERAQGRTGEEITALLAKADDGGADSAAAQEARGYYHLHRQQPDEAAKWFRKAVDLGGGGYLALYYDAWLEMQAAGAQDKERTRRSLRRAIELNPEFAPAHAALASSLGNAPEGLEEALPLARRALELEPDNAWFWVNAGTILLRLERAAEAREAAEKGKALAKTPDDCNQAQSLLASIETYESHARPAQAATPEFEASRTGQVHPEIEKVLEEARRKRGEREVTGTFTELRCPEAAGLDFIIESQGKTFVLHAEGPGKVAILKDGDAVQLQLYCGRQKGLEVMASYVVAKTDTDPSIERGRLRTLTFLDE